MLVKDIMKRNVLFVYPDDNIRDAAKLMEKYGIGSVLVLSKSREVLGIVTEKDVTNVVAEGKNVKTLLVKDVMSKNIISVKEGDTLDDAADLMIDHDIKKLPVEDEKGNLIGIITTSDIIMADYKFVKIFKSMLEAKKNVELDYKYRPTKFFEET